MKKPSKELEQWISAAAEVADGAPPVINQPLHVLFGEAVDVAKFFERYWKPEVDERGHVVRPGLDSAVGKAGKGKKKPAGAVGRIHPKTGDEILSLQRATQEAHTRYLLTINPKGEDPAARGRFLLNELTAVLEWYFDDGVEDEKDAQLARVDAAHADDPQTADALASALDDYAHLAEPHRDEIDGLGGFESGYIEEAHAVAAALRDRPASVAALAGPARASLDLRNRLAGMLLARMNAVRTAARFVFRNHPEIVREATSAYERRKRAAARRAKAKGSSEPEAPAAAPPPFG
ncbi:hypothetical protein SOCE26_075190 [Sorangium cellulosum]|uniref:Uncharacterized protein n=1 Tax=Sorangium cellulosum TaxID=56 RepID=A0A2L0F399_SORCE|nr:hypothetical protein [Sorangium cellulosum]AUX46016.1 hypothetical protein SOCE26_075190 [Sorangium cellulosum]